MAWKKGREDRSLNVDLKRESKEAALVFPTCTVHLPRRKWNLKLAKLNFWKVFYFVNCLWMLYLFPRWYGPEDKIYMLPTTNSIFKPSLPLSYFITGMDRFPISKLSFHTVNFSKVPPKMFPGSQAWWPMTTNNSTLLEAKAGRWLWIWGHLSSSEIMP